MLKKISKYISSNTGYLIRLDDIAENMNWNLMQQAANLFDKYEIKPVLGVIPNNQDPEMKPKEWILELTKEKVLSLNAESWNKNLQGSALKRIKDGTYGFCEDTGEPIGLKRLMARPVATLSIAAQEKHEKEEKVFADD